MASLYEAVITVLTDAGEPLHYAEIATRSIATGRWQTVGKTPAASVNALLSADLARLGEGSRFIRAGKGVYGLRSTDELESTTSGLNQTSVPKTGLSFLDAAERVLSQQSEQQPMHYRDIVSTAIKLGILVTSGRTPEDTLSAQIGVDIERQRRRGAVSRFVRHPAGLVGLSAWDVTGLAGQIVKHNERIGVQLHHRISKMNPADFEKLIGRLLVALGFEDVTVTSYSGDGGVDVRGTLVVGGAVQTRMAVQAKRYKQNVQAQVVREVRGSLGAHERGLIITTSGFSSGAIDEAKLMDRNPVALMDGGQLVALLIEHGIGVRRMSYDLIELEVQEVVD